MAHGPNQAVFGLGRPATNVPVNQPGVLDESEDNDAAAIVAADVLDLDASEVDLADAGGNTANADVESAIDELFGFVTKGISLGTDFDVDSGTTGDTPTATALTVPVIANAVYIVKAVLFVTATTNGGVEVSFSGPSGATAVLQANIFQDTAVVVNDGEMAISDAVNYIAAALSFDRIEIDGVLTVDATAGSFTVLGAQDTAHADNTLIHAGSYLALTRIS